MWMSLEGIALSEMSQNEKDKQCVVSPTHGTRREKTSSQIRAAERGTVAARGWRCEKWKWGVKRHKLSFPR